MWNKAVYFDYFNRSISFFPYLNKIKHLKHPLYLHAKYTHVWKKNCNPFDSNWGMCTGLKVVTNESFIMTMIKLLEVSLKWIVRSITKSRLPNWSKRWLNWWFHSSKNLGKFTNKWRNMRQTYDSGQKVSSLVLFTKHN